MRIEKKTDVSVPNVLEAVLRSAREKFNTTNSKLCAAVDTGIRTCPAGRDEIFADEDDLATVDFKDRGVDTHAVFSMSETKEAVASFLEADGKKVKRIVTKTSGANSTAPQRFAGFTAYLE